MAPAAAGAWCFRRRRSALTSWAAPVVEGFIDSWPERRAFSPRATMGLRFEGLANERFGVMGFITGAQ